MNDLVDRYLDSNGLSNPSIRKRAARKVLGYMDTTGAFLSGGQLALPSDKGVVVSAYKRHKGSALNGAEKSVINHIYELAGSSVGKSASRHAVTPKATKSVVTAPKAVNGLAAAEKKLLQGEFVSVGALSGEMVPDVPGLYCIKLRKSVRLPAKYGKVREDGVIYIGQASTSLRKRFWKQELNHIGAATFFRSIGAMLGYLPPKGSLVGKKNQTNFKFSPEDTEAIRQWMRESLTVNFIAFSTETMDDVEKKLIDKYRPLVNYTHNPDYSRELEAVKDKCREYAEANNHNEKPWYRKSSSWAWITIGVLILTYIIVNAVTDAQEKRAKQNQYKPKSYKEVFTPEEAKKMDIGGHIDGPGDWKPDPNAAKRTKEFIEKGGNADPVGDAIQDGDYHDLLDQNGGPEGF